MAGIQEIPSLDSLLESILDRFPAEAVAAIAAMHPPAASTFADELVHRAHDHARARLDEEARPLPDEPDFIEETRQILRDVKPHKSADDFFAAHGF